MSLAVLALRVSHAEFTNYTYLVREETEKEAILIDPAWELDRIETELARAGARLAGILLTHSHPDHTDLAAVLSRRHGAGVWISRAEAEAHRFHAPNLRLLEDGARLQFGAMMMSALVTPGHTAGGVCYLAGDSLFSGDTLFAEGCGVCQGAGADPRAMFHSLQRLKREVAPWCRVFPGHSFGEPPGRMFSEVARRNIYLAFESEENFVRFRMRPNQNSAMEFV